MCVYKNVYDCESVHVYTFAKYKINIYIHNSKGNSNNNIGPFRSSHFLLFFSALHTLWVCTRFIFVAHKRMWLVLCMRKQAGKQAEANKTHKFQRCFQLYRIFFCCCCCHCRSDVFSGLNELDWKLKKRTNTRYFILNYNEKKCVTKHSRTPTMRSVAKREKSREVKDREKLSFCVLFWVAFGWFFSVLCGWFSWCCLWSVCCCWFVFSLSPCLPLWFASFCIKLFFYYFFSFLRLYIHEGEKKQL